MCIPPQVLCFEVCGFLLADLVPRDLLICLFTTLALSWSWSWLKLGGTRRWGTALCSLGYHFGGTTWGLGQSTSDLLLATASREPACLPFVPESWSDLVLDEFKTHNKIFIPFHCFGSFHLCVFNLPIFSVIFYLISFKTFPFFTFHTSSFTEGP